jgi:hypothetical protein
MQSDGKPVALYLSQGESHKEEFIRKAEAYCQEHGYILWNGDIYQEQDQEPNIALEWVKEVMNGLTIHTLLIPSLQHIHPTDIGAVLNLLIEAQECGVEVLCLGTKPTRLNQFTLAILPLTQEQRAIGIMPLSDIIRRLRLR